MKALLLGALTATIIVLALAAGLGYIYNQLKK